MFIKQNNIFKISLQTKHKTKKINMTKIIVLCVVLLLAITIANASQSRRLQEEETKSQITESEREAYIRWVLRDELAKIESLESSVKDYEALITAQQNRIDTSGNAEKEQQLSTRTAVMKVQLGILEQSLKVALDDYESKRVAFMNDL
jgi:uncharacterized protein YlxW (UPF0749 family)